MKRSFLERRWELAFTGGSLFLFCGIATPEAWLRSAAETLIGFVLVPITVVGIAWFLYAAFLKKLIRARNIRVAREKREMREAVARSREED